MKTIIIALALCFITSMAHASAVIIDTKGQVSINMPNQESVAAQIGLELPDGTEINTNKDANTSIMLSNGTIHEITSKQKYKVGEKVKAKKEKTVVQGLALAMNEATASESGPTVHGMVKMTRLGPGAPKPVLAPTGENTGLHATYPINTAIILPKTIHFSWKNSYKMTFKNPVLVIEDKNKKKLLVKNVSSKKDSLKVRICECDFKPGQKYSWYFASKTKDRLFGKTRRFNFSFLSKGAEKKLKGDIKSIGKMNISKSGQEFLKAQLYFRAKMYDKMVETLLPLWKENPTPLLKKELFLGYSRLGNVKQAKEFQ